MTTFLIFWKLLCYMMKCFLQCQTFLDISVIFKYKLLSGWSLSNKFFPEKILL